MTSMQQANSVLFRQLNLQLRSKVKQEKIVWMEKYMRNQFSFLGVTSPDRKEIISALVPKFIWKRESDFIEFCELCWQKEYREWKYVALDLSIRYAKKLTSESIPYFESLISRGPWWDTIDGIVPGVLGKIMKGDKQKIYVYTEKWIKSDNFWYQRAALLLQLKYKEDTDFDRLKELILERIDSKEFFVNKAAGWALREYSKTNPEKVIHFIQENKLPALVVREGMKVIRKKKRV